MFDLFMHPARWLVSQTSQYIDHYCDLSLVLIDYEGMANLWEGVARAHRRGIRNSLDLVMYAVYFARLKLLYRARHNEETSHGFEAMPMTTQPEPIGRGDFAFELWAEREATIHALAAADAMFVPWYIRALSTREDRIEAMLTPWLNNLKIKVEGQKR